MNKLIKSIKSLLLTFILISCGSIQPELITTTYYNKLFSAEQVDSIIKSENIDKLDSIPIKGSESTYYEYYYLKDSMVIRFIEKRDSIQVTKRINI